MLLAPATCAVVDVGGCFMTDMSQIVAMVNGNSAVKQQSG